MARKSASVGRSFASSPGTARAATCAAFRRATVSSGRPSRTLSTSQRWKAARATFAPSPDFPRRAGLRRPPGYAPGSCPGRLGLQRSHRREKRSWSAAAGGPADGSKSGATGQGCRPARRSAQWPALRRAALRVTPAASATGRDRLLDALLLNAGPRQRLAAEKHRPGIRSTARGRRCRAAGSRRATRRGPSRRRTATPAAPGGAGQSLTSAGGVGLPLEPGPTPSPSPVPRRPARGTAPAFAALGGFPRPTGSPRRRRSCTGPGR